jgi:NitT/TauT family transport system ATP-binding protein
MEVKNLTFSFERQNPLFQNLSLKITPEQITVFLGPSGCGKSTLLRIFAGLQSVNPEFFHYENRKASFVFQEANLLPWMTGEKNIMLPFLFSKEKVDMDFFNEVVQMLKIKECLHQLPATLSGGQKMRVSIARALITRPQILFMDEPFSALDEPTRLNLQDEMLAIQKKMRMTILFVTHSFYEAAYLGDRVLIFSDRRPTWIVFDQEMLKNFKTRFEPEYQKQVQQISNFFIGDHTR